MEKVFAILALKNSLMSGNKIIKKEYQITIENINLKIVMI
jgi:hypothetical protein